ncbi:hypothetical protein [Thalassotalea sp. Y01]|uniref:hypothetical protein n=1 Tax=Thalassotalea sp. Y01 TaxID=2729613 RepID=UPI00145CA9D2|nr:hypothetical protein [Thalassotalea sp. Y01]NMP15453.1 hypothetical protein [Thalassotalea sp. Y01]
MEHNFRGLIDARVTQTDGEKSHLDAHYGKFRFNDGSNASLAQALINYQMDFDNPFSIHVNAMAVSDDIDNEVGILTAHVNYLGLPSKNGHRFTARAGIMYPQISLENPIIGWNSPYTLSFSTMNSWIGEEVRHTGIELGWEKLGRFANSKHNFAINGSFFKHNDTAGTLLSWRGWTVSSRQTLWHERRDLPPIEARFGGMLRFQAEYTDPFIELDHRYGAEINAQWRWNNRIVVHAGHYNNNVDTLVFKHGQYAWDTIFDHVGVKAKLSNNLTLISQYLVGDTLMTSPFGHIVVDNDYHSAYALLSYKLDKHRVSGRLEEFSVTDRDQTPGDDNDEYGKSFTLNYQYQFDKNWQFHAEFNYIDSDRPSRKYDDEPENLTETQYQLAARYFW